MHFSIQPLTRPPTVVIAVAGELDIATAPLLRNAITRSLGRRCTQVSLDLRELTFVDAAGVQALARAQAEAAVRGAHLEITEWSWALERIALWTSARSLMRVRAPVDA